jgi:hypothetical protein
MSHPNKVKGTGYEREIVKVAQSLGLSSKRAWGSNGESLGCSKETDVLIEGAKIQCKRHKKLPDWLDFGGNVDAVMFRENNGATYVMLPLTTYLNFLLDSKQPVNTFNTP